MTLGKSKCFGSFRCRSLTNCKVKGSNLFVLQIFRLTIVRGKPVSCAPAEGDEHKHNGNFYQDAHHRRKRSAGTEAEQGYRRRNRDLKVVRCPYHRRRRCVLIPQFQQPGQTVCQREYETRLDKKRYRYQNDVLRRAQHHIALERKQQHQRDKQRADGDRGEATEKFIAEPLDTLIIHLREQYPAISGSAT